MSRDIGIPELAAIISEDTGVSSMDALRVLEAMGPAIEKSIMFGNRAVLGEVVAISIKPPQWEKVMVGGRWKKLKKHPRVKATAGASIVSAVEKFKWHMTARELAYLGAAHIYYSAARNLEAGVSREEVMKRVEEQLEKRKKQYKIKIPTSTRKEFDHFGEATQAMMRYIKRVFMDSARFE